MKELKIEIVYNATYGGFNLSEEAKEYIIKELCKIYNISYKKVKANSIIREKEFRISKEDYNKLSEYHKKWFYNWEEDKYAVFNDSDIPRYDKLLVEAVKNVNDPSGQFAKLKIAVIDEPRFMIDEYDGFESVVTPNSIDWEIADTEEVREEYPEYFI